MPDHLTAAATASTRWSALLAWWDAVLPPIPHTGAPAPVRTTDLKEHHRV